MLYKKCFLMGIFTLLSLSLAISAQPLHPTTGEPLMMDCLRGTPDAIDGDLSDWNLEAMTPAVLDAVEQLSSGQDIWTGPEDCSADFYMLWDDVNIYMAVVVKDEKLVMNKTGADIWNSDCLEMFFATTDAEAEHPWTNPTIHYQYGFNANNQTWNWCNMDGPGQSVPDYLHVASSVTADGYICEASIEYAQMSALDFSVGNTIGIHPCIDDTDIDEGNTEYQMSWTGLAAHDQSMGYGHMLLSADSVPEPEPAPTIAWVSYHAADDEPSADSAAVGFTQASDIGYTDLLKANGYDVTRVLTTQTPDVDYLNTFDLVIISRSANSGDYSGTGATAWNSVTAPMIITCGYKLRSSRMGFTDGTDMPDTTGDIRLAVTDPTHPIFAGVSITDGVMDNMYAEGAVPLPTDGTISRGISINNNTPDNDGIVLATIAEVSADTGPVGGMVIAEWPAGAVIENSSGSPDDVLGGPRLVFLTGSREPDGVTGGQAAALYDLYPDGEQMFLNAVKYMIPVVPVDPGTDDLVAYYALENDANDSSGNGLDGVIMGDPVFVEGTVGMGLQLDGIDDYVDFGNPDMLNFGTGDWTVCAWIKTTQFGSGDENKGTIFANGGDQSGGMRYTLCVGESTEGCVTLTTDDDSTKVQATTSVLVNDDVWHHVVGMRSGTDMLVYIDGVLAGSNTAPDGYDLSGTSQHNAYIGVITDNRDGTLQKPLGGLVDDVLVYSRALSEGEILYLAGFRSYIYKGDALDDSWDHDNGSDEWDGTGPGEGNAGGAAVFNEDDVTFLRIQDTGDPRDYGMSDPGSNRKIYLTKQIDMGLDGAHMEFRLRVATTPPLDDMNPDGGAGAAPWPEGGIGYHIRDGGKGMIGISEGGGSDNPMQISFSLAKAGEPGFEDLTTDVLVMNSLGGTEANEDTVDTDDADVGAIRNVLSVDDATMWNKVVVDIIAGGSGTHIVAVSVNGGPTELFDVTAGNRCDEDGNYIAIGSSGTGGTTAFDIDYVKVSR